MKAPATVFALLLVSQAATFVKAQTAAGDWDGPLEPAPSHHILKVQVLGKGSFKATTQGPDFSVAEFPVDKLTVDGNKVAFRQGQFGVSFQGTLKGDDLSGTLRMMGAPAQLVLKRQDQGNSIAGTWSGTLRWPAVRFTLHLELTGSGLTGYTEAPQVSPLRSPLDSVTQDGSVLRFSQRQSGFEFVGTIAGDVLSGQILQTGGLPATLRLKRR